jgi:hypothetical protein
VIWSPRKVATCTDPKCLVLALGLEWLPFTIGIELREDTQQGRPPASIGPRYSLCDLASSGDR